MIVRFLDSVGKGMLALCDRLGSFILFFVNTIVVLFTTRLKFRQVFFQMQEIGIGSLLIVVLTGSFTGLAFALQSYIGFSRVGTEGLVGLVVAMGMARELGPVLAGLMVTGRSGSAMAAEIGTMRISEQIDALKTLCIDPIQYLVVPRIVASVLILPALALFAMICGVASGYLLCIYSLGVSSETYLAIIRGRVELSDITGGLIKAAFFGLFLSWVGTYQGYMTSGGAEGVGRATTQTVVVGSIIILIANYFLSSILFQTGIS